ncbi:unnamed protein product [Ceutorhynchus assimilis]|uniref:Uncharacterized protein n=1 Tax=Ceutorhynchus assimilis TaxID=467358 RepID=A0A9N9QDC2_9CUCU|nr:unnamed protein product [Ceutorhynchus assimilis]
MFGGKLRAWMEAVRPKKKQHRKEKQRKNTTPIKDGPSHGHVTWKTGGLLESEEKESKRDSSPSRYVGKSKKHSTSDSHNSRYSAVNLSSPESAYSTGYSTDATSPGGVPLDYLVNTGAKKKTDTALQNRLSPHPHRNSRSPKAGKCKSFSEQTPIHSSVSPNKNVKDQAHLEEKDEIIIANSQAIFGKLPEPTALMSPRQRNRIRTNPWLPGGSNSAVASPMPIKKDAKYTPTSHKKIRNSPIQYRYLSPVTHRKSISSSSCSSLSAAQTHSFEHRYPKSLSDEDDCTLNEMMGKYDESYVYEKETDILSDSDPTDCESDIDTGQDGGDEEENGDEEFDFIDNGSNVEVDYVTGNTGHCMYIMPYIKLRRSSRRRTTKKVKESSSKRRRSTSNKKNHKGHHEIIRHSSLHQDGSKSAGATPLSIRKSILKSSQPKIEEEYVKKRSNSVSLQRDVTTFIIDKSDREADMKYKELIGQAEQIIRTMNINDPSPRRVPGPTNKRVELLRSAECSKPEVPFMSRTNDELLLPNSNIAPSTLSYKNTRFSPKKNHITNFIINQSPVPVRKEPQAGHSPLPLRRMLTEEGHQSPRGVRKQYDQLTADMFYENPQASEYDVNPYAISLKINPNDHCLSSPVSSRKVVSPKSILHKPESYRTADLLSPRNRQAIVFDVDSSSSEEDGFKKNKQLSNSCPQSEPMPRKKYSGKSVAFNLGEDPPENRVGSSENLRQQFLLNTMHSLKRNLEDHSASLQYTYSSSSQNMYL